MGKERRSSPRILVSIKMACASAEGRSLRLHDLSLGGFLASGRLSARAGDRLEGTIHVFPASGDRDVYVAGSIAWILPDGEERILGVRIDAFDSPDGERAYRDFARELQEEA